MKVELIRATDNAASLCGEAAAACTASKDPAGALRHAAGSGHTSVLEHAVFTFRVSGISRACLAQLTRHRLASFSVQSQRHAGIRETDMVMPDSIRASGFRADAEYLMRDVMWLYGEMVRAGIPKEDARYITPQASPTGLIMTMNARELLHFFSLRCCNRAQWEIRELADRMLRLCREHAPGLFDDAGPGCVRGHCPEGRPCGHSRMKEEWDSHAVKERLDTR